MLTNCPAGLAVNGSSRSVLVNSLGSAGRLGRSVRASDARVEAVAQAVDRSGRQRIAGHSRRNVGDRIAKLLNGLPDQAVRHVVRAGGPCTTPIAISRPRVIGRSGTNGAHRRAD